MPNPESTDGSRPPESAATVRNELLGLLLLSAALLVLCFGCAAVWLYN